MRNSGDTILLLAPDGRVLNRVQYTQDEAEEGAVLSYP